MTRVLLPGPPLIGFATLFDGAYGNPATPRPYPRVAPAHVGGVLLPFPCPHCHKVAPAAVHPRRRKGYCDKERGFSWCPACRGRYVLDPQGAPLAQGLPPGAVAAPAQVTTPEPGRI